MSADPPQTISDLARGCLRQLDQLLVEIRSATYPEPESGPMFACRLHHIMKVLPVKRYSEPKISVSMVHDLLCRFRFWTEEFDAIGDPANDTMPLDQLLEHHSKDTRELFIQCLLDLERQLYHGE